MLVEKQSVSLKLRGEDETNDNSLFFVRSRNKNAQEQCDCEKSNLEMIYDLQNKFGILQRRNYLLIAKNPEDAAFHLLVEHDEYPD